ncbi:transketolase [Amorphus orientalis]|uniref:Transketolase n=1 Tax=Amorphus orientalis TaxID=649198 RepID=A0AAE3VS73_9HYPH|nr:transketolase [Amorphus orientalis]MDQ0316983.1 transketolase [Amorphus orientalis]
MIDLDKHKAMANAIRVLAIDAVEAAKSGHPGMPMGTADIATVLFSSVIKVDPSLPDWPDRDRFVLSAGHGSMLLYSVLHLLGYEDFSTEELKRFRQLGARTAGHPEYGHGAGIETTTGPLGQGISTAVGMALAERMMNARYGDDLVDHRTYVIASDGDLMEGISHEAISLAGHLRLNRLIVLYDDNQISIDGPLDLSESGDALKRFEAAGWNASRIDGHNASDILAALEAAKTSDKPTLIACRTTIGYGSPNKAGTSASHGSPLGAAEAAAARDALDWHAEPFEIPADVRDAWRIAGLRSGHARKAWEKKYQSLHPDERAEFDRQIRGDLPPSFSAAMEKLRGEIGRERPTLATRKASENVLAAVNAEIPETVGGSADLTGSNNTKTKDLEVLTADNYGGRYIHWGVREQGMAAAMNGMALHGGLIPYGGTFLVFTDYCRPAIRLAALMGVRVVYVMTHDSIGLGEDGPTHQPVEHLAALRAMPNLVVLRPADALETAEAWEIALERKEGPTLLALTRQNCPAVRGEESHGNRSKRGAYEVAASGEPAVVSLFATGSEVGLAVKAKGLLDMEGIPTRVVSVPSFELFERQSADYRGEVIGDASIKVGIEAAVRMGWDRLIGTDGIFVGMTGFGASAPYEELYEHFGITPEAVVALVKARMADA